MKKKKSIKEKLSDFFIDIAKLVFGGVVLSLIISMDINKSVVLLIGTFATISLALFGFYLYKKS